MPKTIAITPSWYWPAGTTRVTGVPPFGLHEMLVQRLARHNPDKPAVVSASERLTAAEFDALVRTAAAGVGAACPGTGCITLCANASVEGVALLFAAVAAGRRVRLHHPGVALGGGEPAKAVLADAAGVATASAAGAPVLRLADLTAAGQTAGPTTTTPLGLNEAAVAVAGGPGGASAWHSHHSLLATAVSVATYFQVDASVPWVCAQPLASWEGLAAITTPLFAGSTLVLADGEPLPQAISREGAGYAYTDLDTAVTLTKDAKRDVKNLRGVLRLLLLSVPAMFDPDLRRRVGRAFDCPAITMFGSVETGPVFASHPSWYLDESVGIPITNAHVVPVDPRSGAPIQTLWELVESARVTVDSPSRMVGYDRASGLADPPEGERIKMAMIASSDANGMIYLLPD